MFSAFFFLSENHFEKVSFSSTLLDVKTQKFLNSSNSQSYFQRSPKTEEEKQRQSFKNATEQKRKNRVTKSKKIHSNKNSFAKCDKKVEVFKPTNLNEIYDWKNLNSHPNLPPFLIRSKTLSKLIPPVYSIRWSGTLYQESWEEHPKCYLYSANFDARLDEGLVVRVLSLCEENNLGLNSFCQFWYNETQNPYISPIYRSEFPGLYNGNNVELKATMMTCKIPPQNYLKNNANKETNKFPIAVSIVKKPCTRSTNILRIDASPVQRRKNTITEKNMKIGVCGKAMFYYNYDFSTRLIEWIEIMKLVGVSKFMIYEVSLHENVKKVLDYYEEKGVLQIISFHFPSPIVQEGTFFRLWAESSSNFQQFMGAQKIFYTDCILRYKDWFDYLAVFDYDEVPVLRKHRNLQELLMFAKTMNKDATVFYLPWKLHFDQFEASTKTVNISENLHIIRHNVRIPFNRTLRTERAGKTIHDTRNALYATVHGAPRIRSFPPLQNKRMVFQRDAAYLGHFRDRPCDAKCSKNGLEEENRLLEHKDEVKKQMDFVINEIELQRKK